LSIWPGLAGPFHLFLLRVVGNRRKAFGADIAAIAEGLRPHPVAAQAHVAFNADGHGRGRRLAEGFWQADAALARAWLGLENMGLALCAFVLGHSECVDRHEPPAFARFAGWIEVGEIGRVVPRGNDLGGSRPNRTRNIIVWLSIFCC